MALHLGEYEGYVLTVNQSNVEPELVTYHLWKDGDEYYAREDAIVDENDPQPDEHIYLEAERRYNELGRPDAGEWEPLS